MSGYGFIAMASVLLSVLITGLVTCSLNINKRANDEFHPKVIRENSIGCVQYSFKGDRYWKCPKELDIDYIEESSTNGKTVSTKQYPVVN